MSLSLYLLTTPWSLSPEEIGLRAWLIVECLAISQVLRSKLYNSCLIFVSYKKFYYYAVPVLVFSFLLFLIYSLHIENR